MQVLWDVITNQIHLLNWSATWLLLSYLNVGVVNYSPWTESRPLPVFVWLARMVFTCLQMEKKKIKWHIVTSEDTLNSNVTIHKLVFIGTQPLIRLGFVYVCFHTTMVEESGCSRNHMAQKTCNIYYLDL